MPATIEQIVVVSGKGGTGKTSVVASLAALANDRILVDCDVDAPDLHLLLAPRPVRTTDFRAGRKADVDLKLCTGCGRCKEVCRFGAVEQEGASGREFVPRIAQNYCEGCGACRLACAAAAISLREPTAGHWFVSDTRLGPLVHARLKAGAENSGRLVTLLRMEATVLAEAGRVPLILVDGPPGIGCPVIASLTGASYALVVTEPSVSGLHDLRRILELCRRLDLSTGVCINRWDLSPRASLDIEQECERRGVLVLGRIPYDRDVTRAQLAGSTVVEHGYGPAAQSLRGLFKALPVRVLQTPASSRGERWCCD